jgi:N-acetylmuramoyl-L-alanine amidase
VIMPVAIKITAALSKIRPGRMASKTKATIRKNITATTIQASNVIICSNQNSNIKRIIKIEVKWGNSLVRNHVPEKAGLRLLRASDFRLPALLSETMFRKNPVVERKLMNYCLMYNDITK